MLQLPDEEGRYELVEGEIVRILPTRKHDSIAEFISDSFKAVPMKKFHRQA
ncbi:MAG: Uma2 family endonuclease [Stigonema ocellatum SAG 48.90 = DSM 106950]|nr:Uma2 family endonuclease [Stigonema ocellatum SAG 48.90 = DSM 106950]